MRLRLAVALAIAVFPNRLHRGLGRLLLGWQVDRTARLGHSVIDARIVTIGPRAVIGHCNMIKGLDRLDMGQGSMISFFNWISSPPRSSSAFPDSPNRMPELVLGEGAVLTGRHVVDCTDSVTLEPFAAVAGYRSTLLTHSVDLEHDCEQTASVRIGSRTLVSSHCLVLPGATIAPHCVIDPGSVVDRPLTEAYTRYGGVPALTVAALPTVLARFRSTDTRPGRITK